MNNKTYPLKLIAVALNDPAAFACTAVDVSIVLAMFTPAPHGDAVLGRFTLFRTGVPETPSAGATAACAVTWSASARTRAADVQILENIMTVLNGVGEN